MQTPSPRLRHHPAKVHILARILAGINHLGLPVVVNLMHFRTGRTLNLLGIAWVKDKENARRDMMDAVRPTMTTVVLNALEICREISQIALEMALLAVDPAVGVPVQPTWTATDASLSGRGLEKRGRMTEEGLCRGILVKVVGLLRNGMSLRRAVVHSIRPVTVRVGALHSISKANLEMDATGSLAQCHRLLSVLTSTLIAPAGSMSVLVLASYLIGHLDPAIEPVSTRIVRL